MSERNGSCALRPRPKFNVLHFPSATAVTIYCVHVIVHSIGDNLFTAHILKPDIETEAGKYTCTTNDLKGLELGLFLTSPAISISDQKRKLRELWCSSSLPTNGIDSQPKNAKWDMSRTRQGRKAFLVPRGIQKLAQAWGNKARPGRKGTCSQPASNFGLQTSIALA